MTPRSSRQTYGITLKHEKKFHHDFNVEHIARIEAKQLKVSGELENLENMYKETFDQIFKGLTGNYMSKKRQLKQNGRKRKWFEKTSNACIISALKIPWQKSFPTVSFILPA